MKAFYLLKSLLLFLGLLVIALVVMVFGIPCWGNPVLNQTFIRIFSRFARAVIGVRLEIIDGEKIRAHRPAVLIGNHQSALDFAFIGTIAPEYSVIVGKREILYIPIFGWFFKIAGNLLIDRANKRDSHHQVNQLASILVEKNLTVSIFPEGTRNKKSNEELLPFKKGPFHIAFAKGLPIIPVVCSSLKDIAVWERLELAGGHVIVKVLDPVETKGVPMNEMNSLVERIRAQMQQELNALNGKVKQG